MAGADANEPQFLRFGIDRTGRTPLATQIAAQLRSQIAAGVLAAGDRLPTLSELAEHLGINVHTVRAAYTQLAADDVIKMQRGSRSVVLGYDIRSVHPARVGVPTFMIGVLVPHFSDYYAEFLQAATESAELEGWLPVVCQTRQYENRALARHLDQLLSRGVDGVIAMHFETPEDTETMAVLKAAADIVPFVFVDSADVAIGSHILVDRIAGAQEATRHLLDHGYRRVAYISTPSRWSSAELLGRGYVLAHREAGVDYESDLVVAASDMSLGAGAKAAAQLMHLDQPPDAIFCAGDILALGALRHLRDIQVRVPQDVSVMGYGELPFSSLAGPSLSSTRLPARELGASAIETLRNAIDDGEHKIAGPIQTSLTVRRSCGCP